MEENLNTNFADNFSAKFLLVSCVSPGDAQSDNTL